MLRKVEELTATDITESREFARHQRWPCDPDSRRRLGRIAAIQPYEFQPKQRKFPVWLPAVVIALLASVVFGFWLLLESIER